MIEDLYYAYNPWWEDKEFDAGIPREDYLDEIKKSFQRKQIDIIIGSRRVGKTTFLKQLIKSCLNRNIPAKRICYLALDHPRFIKITISEHLRYFRKLFGHSISDKLYLYLDEVQSSPNWEAELKILYDLENLKIICTGSTSSLIKQQGGKLTGRQIITQIFPLSFREFLRFKGNLPLSAESYKYENLFEEYLQVGGYPENALEPSEEYLNNLIDDIIARDIVSLHRINRPDLLKQLFTIIATSVGSRSSFNKIAKILGITVDTVKEYISFLEEAFLIKTLTKWSASYSDKIYAQKKIYLYDTGMKSVLTGHGDIGYKVENVIFSFLIKNNKNIGYYAESEKELDFAYDSYIYPLALEVKYESIFDWEDKKYRGIRLFLKRYPNTKKVTIISKSVEKTIDYGQITIEVIPAWKYLLAV